MNWLFITRFKVMNEMPCSCGMKDCKAYGLRGLLCVVFFKRFELGFEMLVDAASRDQALVTIGRRLGYVEFAVHATILLAIAFAITGVL